MKFTNLLISILLALLFSCSVNKYDSLNNQCLDEISSFDLSFSVDNSLSIFQSPELDGKISSYFYYKSKTSEYIVSCLNGQSIAFYNMTSGKLENVIEPNKDVPHIREIGNFFIKNQDSIFFFRDVPPKAFLVNSKGVLMNSWDLEGAPINWGTIDRYALFGFHDGFFMDENKFYISLNTSSFFGIKDRQGLKTQAIYDYKLDKWDTVFGQLPEFYSGSEPIDFVGTFTEPHRVFGEGNIVISYPQSHEIQVYKKNGELEGEYCAGSEFVKAFDNPILKKEAGDRQESFQRFAAAPAYLGLYYHSDLNIYTRLVRHKFDLVLESGKFRSPCDIQYSLIILDADFNKIGETRLDGQLYDWRFAKATSTGFWLMPICENWPGEDAMNYTTHLKLKLLDN